MCIDLEISGSFFNYLYIHIFYAWSFTCCFIILDESVSCKCKFLEVMNLRNAIYKYILVEVAAATVCAKEIQNWFFIHFFSFTFTLSTYILLLSCMQGIPYEIDDDVEVLPTPGHTSEDVSVLVKSTNLGTVVVAGYSHTLE